MTIKRTREIFGCKFANKTDSEILEFIQAMGTIGDEFIDLILSDTLILDNKDKYSDREVLIK